MTCGNRTVLLPHDRAVCHEAEPMALPGRAVRGALLPAGTDASVRFFRHGHRWTHRAVAERRGGKETWLGLVLASGSSPACRVERAGGAGEPGQAVAALETWLCGCPICWY